MPGKLVLIFTNYLTLIYLFEVARVESHFAENGDNYIYYLL